MRDRLLAGAVVLPFLMGAASAPTHPGREEFTFQDPAIVESSGLVVADGLFVTTNDSGDTGRVFTVDPADGETVGVTTWADDPTDVEALAPAGDGVVWAGDIGDNGGSRDSIEVARVPVGRGDRGADPTTYDLIYPDGPVNAESLLTDPKTGRLYVASKDVFGGVLYAAPARLDPDRANRLRAVGPVLPIATDGAFFPDGRHLVLRDYSHAVVYTFPGLEPVGSFRLPDQHQGEGIAVSAGGTLYVSSEGQQQPVLRVPLPADVRRAIAPASPSPSPSTSPSSSPSTSPSATPRHEAAAQEHTDRPVWPWLLTGLVGLGALAVLLRALRPR